MRWIAITAWCAWALLIVVVFGNASPGWDAGGYPRLLRNGLLLLIGGSAVIGLVALAVLAIQRWFGWSGLKILHPSEILLSVQTGTVASVKVWSETHVSSSGTYDMGSGTPGYADYRPGGYRVTNVSSSVRNRVQFFLALDDGSEDSFTDSPNDFPVREGQRVSVVWGTSPRAKQKARWLALLYNHATRKVSSRSLEKIRGSSSPLGWRAFVILLLVSVPSAWMVHVLSYPVLYLIHEGKIEGGLFFFVLQMLMDVQIFWSDAMTWTVATMIGPWFIFWMGQIGLRQARADAAILARARALAEAEAAKHVPVAAPA